MDETKILANSTDFYGLKSLNNNKRGDSVTYSVNSEVENNDNFHQDVQKEGGESQISSDKGSKAKSTKKSVHFDKKEKEISEKA